MRYCILFLLSMMSLSRMAASGGSTLKILDIGNSYALDATYYLSALIKASGTEQDSLCVYVCFTANGSFKQWYDIYHDADTLHYYKVYRRGGTLPCAAPLGHGNVGDGSLIRKVLSSEQWDIIILHQERTYAPYYNLWTGHGNGGYLNEYLSLIRGLQPDARIGFVLAHSQWDEYRSNREKSSYLRWKKTADSTQRFCEDYGVDLIIPCGTAIENLRTSSLNNEYDLTRDGTHICAGLGYYTAACCYYESMIAPFSGISILGNSLRCDISGFNTMFPAIEVTDENALTAQRAAYLAVQYPYECINPEDYYTSIGKRCELGPTVPIGEFDLMGKPMMPDRKGIRIVRDAHGKTRKVLYQ